MFNIQRPPAWLFNALGIISGGAPLLMWHELQATVDVAQGGLGLDGSHTFGRLKNGIGVPQFQQVNQTADVDSGKYAWLFRCWYDNNDSAAVGFGSYYGLPGGGTMHIVKDDAVAAGGFRLWADIAQGMQFFYIPPGRTLFVLMTAATTAISELHWELIRVPAGTKPW